MSARRSINGWVGFAALAVLALALAYFSTNNRVEQASAYGTTETQFNVPKSVTDTPVSTPTVPPCGQVWRVVSSPNQGADSNYLQGVAAVSANDVWAVGHYNNGSDNRDQTLTMHWDGSQWIVVSSPNPGSLGNYLYEVEAVSANDVWAVGSYYEGGGYYGTLTMHWDGSLWRVVPSPNP